MLNSVQKRRLYWAVFIPITSFSHPFIRNSTMSLTTLVLRFLSLKYAFGIISMFFTLVRCSIILSRLFLTYLHPCFLPYVQIYWISVRLLMSHEKCPIWQVLFIIKFGTFTFFFVLYCILFNFIMFYSKCLKCHTCFFVFVYYFLYQPSEKGFLVNFLLFFLTVTIP